MTLIEAENRAKHKPLSCPVLSVKSAVFSGHSEVNHRCHGLHGYPRNSTLAVVKYLAVSFWLVLTKCDNKSRHKARGCVGSPPPQHQHIVKLEALAFS